MIKSLALLAATLSPLQADETLSLVLPTENRALLDGTPEDFYMYVGRTFEGQNSTPWTAGQYGFVRTLRRTEEDGVIATKFHEGVDIKPVKRDRNGNPLDEIRAIAAGVVVHTGVSKTYGKYAVIKHDWDCGPFFSLYAHLSRIDASIGDKLMAGQSLGVMGYTGDGLSRVRAHLHLELCMLSSAHFDEWLGGTNPHGIYNGLNLIGIDIASLFLATNERDDVTIPAFLKGAQPYFKVAIPRKGDGLEITTRYPWLKKGSHDPPSPSWEIAFTDSGIPLSVTPSHREVTEPTVTFVRTTRSRHEYYTRSRLTGSGRNASLTRSGLRFIELLSQESKTPTSATTDSDDS
jgi:murein DD-endopeptidase MepM/ murein hydrolase activator NlpD